MASTVIDLCDDSDDDRPSKECPRQQPIDKTKSQETEQTVDTINLVNDSAATSDPPNVSAKYKHSDFTSCLNASLQVTNVTSTVRPVTVEARKRRKLNSQDIIVLLDDQDNDGKDSDDEDDELLGFSSGLGRRKAKTNEISDRKPPAKSLDYDPMLAFVKQNSSVADIQKSVDTCRSNDPTYQEIIELDDFSAAESPQRDSSENPTKSKATRITVSSVDAKPSPIVCGPSHSKLVAPSLPITNPYRTSSQSQTFAAVRDKVTLPSETTLRIYPRLLDTSKEYRDERARFLIAFWKYGRRNCTRRSFERPKLDIIAKRIVKLALSEYPIRSLEEYVSASSSHKAVSSLTTLRKQLEDELIEGGLEHIVTPYRPNCTGRQRFYSIVEAALAGFWQIAKERLPEGHHLLSELKDKSMWIALEDFIPKIDELLLPGIPKLTRSGEPDNGASYLTQSSTRSLEFLQIVKLETDICGGPLLKRHKLRSIVHYELLPAGLEVAKRIVARAFPDAPGHYRCSKLVETDYEHICIGVDLREGGGGKKLHMLCDKLEMQKIPYFVGHLSIGDYVFFTKDENGSMDLLCPILVERKSVQDIAKSIDDGRWVNQKRRMYAAQYVFGYDKCRMAFIVEGNINKQTVSGDYIGARWLNVTVEKLNEEIEILESEGFDVLRTTSPENSMFELARWTRRVAKDVSLGKMVAQYTYQSFKREVAKIPQRMDFSRIAKDHAAQRAQKTRAAQIAEALSSPAAHSPDHQKPEDEYSLWKKSELEAECASVGLPKTGPRSELIKRLRGPKPPQVWLERKRLKQYVPASHCVGGTALLVALYLHEEEQGCQGISKDDLYVKAEGLNITKNPFSGGTTQTGPYHYDGWSSMSSLLSGDPALVTQKKGKFKLTRSCAIAGYQLAKALHLWCHEHGNCSCTRQASDG